MLVVERRNTIKKMIEEQGIVSVCSLSQSFGVSETTIRRDLDFLEGENILRKIHGGAMLHEQNDEPLYKDRTQKLVSEKQEIAQMASSLISNGDTILLDSGTTTAGIVPYLAAKKDLTVVTNSINIAYQLQDFEQIEVVMIGGNLRHRTGSMIGSIALETLKGIYVDKLFLSCSGFCLQGGVTVPNLVSVEVRIQMINSSKDTILLADHTKIGKRFLARICGAEQIQLLVTDSKADEEQIAPFTKMGIPALIPNHRKDVD